jgi:SpoVK/Ycf46/Vps4 family AAA+-type ATPase
VTSVSNGRSLWIATCNSIGDLPPELRRRFTLGTFFFDLPDEEERAAIWEIYRHKYRLRSAQHPGPLLKDEGWTGAEIRQCCDLAWRLGCSLADAAKFVVPVSVSAAEQLDRLRKAAEGRFLSASTTGVYRRPSALPPPPHRSVARSPPTTDHFPLSTFD